MDHQSDPQMVVRKSQLHLEPFIRERHEVAKIRQLLSSHLVSQIKSKGENLNRPLSLIDSGCDVDHISHGTRGLQKEYLKCVRANIKARDEYNAINKQHLEDQRLEDIRPDKQDEGLQQPTKSSTNMTEFIHLNIQRRKHERLRIEQDYFEVLSQKPAANIDYLNPSESLRDIESPPKVPPEVLHDTSSAIASDGSGLKTLVDRLEKSVLRAKMLLKKEQKLLEEFKYRNDISSTSTHDRLQALGLTRNALINWIEAEMEKAGDESLDNNGPPDASRDPRGQEYIESQLKSIQKHYDRYIEARTALVSSVSSSSDIHISHTGEESIGKIDAMDDLPQIGSMQDVLPTMERIVSIASEQKGLIQHRSHITISLAKQVKEASQGLDRLADESHLLPAYPMPSAVLRRRGLESPLSLNEELMHLEKPDSASRAQGWVHAARSAGIATKEAVLEQMDIGNEGLSISRESMSAVQQLLGYGDHTVGERETKKQDIWAVLDGCLGVLNSDSLDGS